LDITGDIDIRCKVALDDWTPASSTVLVAKWVANPGLRAYQFVVNTSGTLGLFTSVDGNGNVSYTSTVAPTVADGETLWVRVTLDVDNGALGKTATFFTSTDGIVWTQLGSPITTAGTTSIIANTSILEIGSITNGLGGFARGKFFRAQVLNGIGGTLVFDANFENSITSLNQASFTESSTNGATVTINRSGSTFRSAGVIDAGYLYPGATNTFSNSTIDYLNFGASDSFTVLVASRQANYTATQFLISKAFSLSASGYLIRNSTGTPAIPNGQIFDTIAGTSLSGPTRTNLALTVSTLARNTIADNVVVYTNSTAGTAVTDTTTTSLSTATPLTIGRESGGSQYADMELYAAAVFRQALTAAQIRQINNYFANREVYL
jgi:hypothetical protein